MANLTYAEYLQILEIKKAFRVKKCGNLLTFTKSEDGLKLYQTWFCKSRLCPLCAWRYAMKNSYELSSILDVFYKRYPKSRFLFLTLTEENAKQGELKEKLAEMNRALYKLFSIKVQKTVRIRTLNRNYSQSKRKEFSSAYTYSFSSIADIF